LRLLGGAWARSCQRGAWPSRRPARGRARRRRRGRWSGSRCGRAIRGSIARVRRRRPCVCRRYGANRECGPVGARLVGLRPGSVWGALPGRAPHRAPDGGKRGRLAPGSATARGADVAGHGRARPVDTGVPTTCQTLLDSARVRAEHVSASMSAAAVTRASSTSARPAKASSSASTQRVAIAM
jgi:hypothetical protein